MKRKVALKLIQRHKQGAAPRGHTPLALKAAADAYIRAKQLTAKPDSVTLISYHVDILEGHFGMDYDLARLCIEDVHAYIKARQDNNIRNTTINSSLCTLRGIVRYHWLETRKIKNPPIRIKRLTTPKPEPKVLTPDEMKLLLQAAEKFPPTDVVILIGGHAGLRHQEIAHLRRMDVDLHANVLRVRCRADWSTKTHTDRSVPMSATLRARLAAHLDTVGSDPEAYLFPGAEGGAIYNFDRWVVKAFKAAGLYDLSRRPGLHMLRRTFTTSLLDPKRPGGAVDWESVRKLGGWADYKTMRNYVATTDDRMRSAVAGFDQA